MAERRRFLIGTRLLYDTAFEEERARLIDTAQSQACLLEAVARFDSVHSRDYPGGAGPATLSQIIDAHEQGFAFGETGEFDLARREGDRIVLLLSHRSEVVAYPAPVPFHSGRLFAILERIERQKRDGTIDRPE